MKKEMNFSFDSKDQQQQQHNNNLSRMATFDSSSSSSSSSDSLSYSSFFHFQEKGHSHCPDERTPKEWIQWFTSFGSESTAAASPSNNLLSAVRWYYGKEEDQVTNEDIQALLRRFSVYTEVVQGFMRTYPELQDSPIFIVRSPARLNLRGMHIDNHGGTCNGFAIDRETILVASPSSSSSSSPSLLTIRNANPEFQPALVLDIEKDLQLNSPELEQLQIKHKSSWTRYVIGTLLAIREHFSPTSAASSSSSPWSLLRPFTAFVSGDIPTGAAAASSHTFVLAITLAHIATTLHHFHHSSSSSSSSSPSPSQLPPIPLVDLILLGRFAEGKAGAVTGLADQGLMVFSHPGRIASSSFYQGDIEAIKPHYVPFPPLPSSSSSSSPLVDVVMVDSLRRRNLAGVEAKDYAIPRFAYSVSLGLLKEAMRRLNSSSSLFDEEFISSIDRLSLVNPLRFARRTKTKNEGEEDVAVRTGEGTKIIYRLLKLIPERAEVSFLLKEYPSLEEVISKAKEAYLSKIPPEFVPEQVDLRGALLFGISECARADLFYSILQEYELCRHRHQTAKEAEEANIEDTLRRIGELMNVGHDGDRREAGRRVNDAYLETLISRLEANPIDSTAQLWRQPGDFRASVKELDEIQEILVTKGKAFGACLTGAGLGGVVVGLIPRERLEDLRKSLKDYFQTVRGIERTEAEVLQVVRSVAGTGYLSSSFIASTKTI